MIKPLSPPLSAYRLVGVQTGTARKVAIQGRCVLTAIHKIAQTGAIPVGPLGLLGDEQADLSVHGGLDKAVYAYPMEHYAFWESVRADAGVASLGDGLHAGAMGENLSIAGVVERDVWLGDVLQFPNCVLRVTQPREPCFKFNAAMGFSKAVWHMANSGFSGFYLAVDAPGTLQANEAFTLIPGPRRVSVLESFNAKMFKHRR